MLGYGESGVAIVADLYEQLKQQQLAISTKRIVRRQLAPSTTVLGGGSPADPSVPPTSTPALPEGANSMTFIVAENRILTRYNIAPYPVSPSWPPDGVIQVSDDEVSSISAGKTRYLGGDGLSTYYVTNALVKFDTSGLPDTATITSASIKITVGGHANTENRNLMADWYTWTAVTGDWTYLGVPGALSGVPISSIPASGVAELQLENAPANVSKTGFTYLRFTLSGGAPDNMFLRPELNDGISGNQVSFYALAYENGTWMTIPPQAPIPGVAPRLTVRYA